MRHYLILKTDGTQTTHAYAGDEPPLKDLQLAVGGYIEGVQVAWAGEVCDGFVNEEGKLKGLPVNMAATAIYRGRDIIVGNLVIILPEGAIEILPAEQCLAAIAQLLDGTEWDSDTMSQVAALVMDAGYEIRSPEDMPQDEEPPAGGGDPHCLHTWNQTAAEADEHQLARDGQDRIYCTKCGADGDA